MRAYAYSWWVEALHEGVTHARREFELGDTLLCLGTGCYRPYSDARRVRLNATQFMRNCISSSVASIARPVGVAPGPNRAAVKWRRFYQKVVTVTKFCLWSELRAYCSSRGNVLPRIAPVRGSFRPTRRTFVVADAKQIKILLR
eukprot:1189275-Prorocentrum_minimum.AAC.1